MFLLEKRVIRAIAFETFPSPSTPIFSGLKILKSQDLFHLKLSIFVHEPIYKTSPVFFYNCFETLASVHQYGTRQDNKRDTFPTQKIPSNMVSDLYVASKMNVTKGLRKGLRNFSQSEENIKNLMKWCSISCSIGGNFIWRSRVKKFLGQ